MVKGKEQQSLCTVRHMKKKLNRSTAGNITIFIILLLFGAFMVLPIVYAVVQSIKPIEELFIYPPRFYVKRPTLDNFRSLISVASDLWVPFERYLFNSAMVSVIGTIGHVILASMAAYPLAKHKFPGAKILFNMIVLSLLFASQVTALPQYIIMAKVGMIDTYWALILPSLAMTLGLYLMKQFMEQIPDTMLEAAQIDGAGEFRIYFRIVMPQVKPAWLTLIIFAFQAIWNQAGLSFVFSEEMKLLPTVLRQISSAGIARAGVGSAATLLLMIPPILTFIIAQGSVMETMTHSGMKD